MSVPTDILPTSHYTVICHHIYGRLLGEKQKEDSSADRQQPLNLQTGDTNIFYEEATKYLRSKYVSISIPASKAVQKFSLSPHVHSIQHIWLFPLTKISNKMKIQREITSRHSVQNFLCFYPRDPELGSCRNPTCMFGLSSTQSPCFSYKVFMFL